MEPIEEERDLGWGIFTDPGPVLPAKHLRINFGAPGDRRDAGEYLWLAWPRPSWSGSLEPLSIPLDLEVEGSRPEPQFVPRERAEFLGTGIPWVYSSGYESIRQIERRLALPDAKAKGV